MQIDPIDSRSQAEESEFNVGEGADDSAAMQSASTVADTAESMDIAMQTSSQLYADESAVDIDIEQISLVHVPEDTEMSTDDEMWPQFDLGKWIEKSSTLSDAQKTEILKKRWVPPESYNFREDSDDPKRKFKHSWLIDYAPWLTYSKKLKGGLCLYCILFPPNTVQGVLGAFTKTAFTKYKDLHEECKSHARNRWHRAAMISAKSFMDDIPVNVQLISGHEQLIEENKKILSHIISTIIFCGTHDIALRGKSKNSGNFYFLFKRVLIII